MLATEIANYVVMVVTLLQQSNFMRGDIVKLNQHAFDRNIPTIEGSTVHDGSVATMAQNNVTEYPETTNLKNTVHFNNIV